MARVLCNCTCVTCGHARLRNDAKKSLKSGKKKEKIIKASKVEKIQEKIRKEKNA